MNFKKKSIFHRGEDDAYEPEEEAADSGNAEEGADPASTGAPESEVQSTNEL